MKPVEPVMRTKGLDIVERRNEEAERGNLVEENSLSCLFLRVC